MLERNIINTVGFSLIILGIEVRAISIYYALTSKKIKKHAPIKYAHLIAWILSMSGFILLLVATWAV